MSDIEKDFLDPGFDEGFDDQEDDSEGLIFTDLPVDEDDEELVEALDDAITEAEYEEYQKENPTQVTHRFSQQELIRLKEDFESDDPEISAAAKDLVYRNYKGLVHFVMTHYYGTYTAAHHDDLIQQGNIGIMTGFHDYKPDHKGQFYQPSTIITRHIRHEMREFIANIVGGTTTKYHSTGQKMIEIIRRKKAAGEEVNPGDIANELGISLTTAKHSLKAVTINSQKVSLDDTVQDGETKIMDMTPSSIETPEEAILHKEFRDQIKKAIDIALNDKQRQVVILKYGLDNDEQRTLNEIARITGIRIEDVRSILSSGTTRLRQYMSSNPMFASEHKNRTQRGIINTQRSVDDLQRELDSYDFSSLGDLDF